MVHQDIVPSGTHLEGQKEQIKKEETRTGYRFLLMGQGLLQMCQHLVVIPEHDGVEAQKKSGAASASVKGARALALALMSAARATRASRLVRSVAGRPAKCSSIHTAGATPAGSRRGDRLRGLALLHQLLDQLRMNRSHQNSKLSDCAKRQIPSRSDSLYYSEHFR